MKHQTATYITRTLNGSSQAGLFNARVERFAKKNSAYSFDKKGRFSVKKILIPFFVFILTAISLFAWLPFFNKNIFSNASAVTPISAGCNLVFANLDVGKAGDVTKAEYYGKPYYPQANNPNVGLIPGPRSDGKSLYSYREVSSWPGGISLGQTVQGSIGLVRSGVGVQNTNTTKEALGSAVANASTPNGNRGTLEEEYGYSLRWAAWPVENMGAECGMGSLMNALTTDTANIFLSIYSVFAGFLINIFSLALSVDIFSFFIETIAKIATTLRDALFLEYLIPVGMIAALWIAWQGMVKKRASVGVQAIVWMVFVIGFSMYYLLQPLQVMRFTAQTTESFVVGLMTILPSTISNNSGSDSCVPPNLGEIKNDTLGSTSVDRPDANRSVGNNDLQRVFKCITWKTFYYNWWAFGQFGYKGSQLRVTEDAMVNEDAKNVVKNNPRYTTQNGAVSYEGAPLPEVYLEGFQMSRDEVLFVDADGTAAEGVKQINKPQSRFVVGSLLSCASGEGQANSNACPYSYTWGAFQGNNVGEKISALFVGFVSLIFGMAPLVVLAGFLIFYGIVNIFLWAVAPVILLIGLNPGFGRKVLLNWFEQLVSNFLKQIMTGLLIGVVIFLFLILYTTPGIPFLVQLITISGVGVGALVFRGKMMKGVSNVNFGGGGRSDDFENSTKSLGKSVSGVGAYAAGQGSTNYKAARGAGAGWLRSGAAAAMGAGAGTKQMVMSGNRKALKGNARRSFHWGEKDAGRKIAPNIAQKVAQKEFARQELKTTSELAQTLANYKYNEKGYNKTVNELEELENMEYFDVLEKYGTGKGEAREKLQNKAQELAGRNALIEERMLDPNWLSLKEGAYKVPFGGESTYLTVDSEGVRAFMDWDGEKWTPRNDGSPVVSAGSDSGVNIRPQRPIELSTPASDGTTPVVQGGGMMGGAPVVNVAPPSSTTAKAPMDAEAVAQVAQEVSSQTARKIGETLASTQEEVTRDMVAGLNDVGDKIAKTTNISQTQPVVVPRESGTRKVSFDARSEQALKDVANAQKVNGGSSTPKIKRPVIEISTKDKGTK